MELFLACFQNTSLQQMTCIPDLTSQHQHLSDEELRSSKEEEEESQITNQVTDEMVRMECKDEPELQILKQQHTSMDVEACVECPVASAAQQPCENEEENHGGCSDDCPAVNEQSMREDMQPGKPCRMQQVEKMQEDEETQQECNNDSSQTRNARQMRPLRATVKINISKKIMSPEADHDSSLSDEDSNEETDSSDEEFVPDSETELDDDSDIERPKKKSKTSVTPGDLDRTPQQITLETNQQPLSPIRNHILTKTTKLNFCFVCGKPRAKIARHLKLHRNESYEIATAFKLRKNSRQRAHILEVLRNRGNYQHNKLVLVNGTGLIKVKRSPKYNIDTQNFEYCMYCKGLYLRKELWRHVKRCLSNPESDRRRNSRSVSGVMALSRCPHLKNISEDVKKMLCDLHQDEVAETVRNDEYVLKLAQDFFDKKGNSKESHAFVRQTIRCIGQFLFHLRNKYKIGHLAEAIKPTNFTVLTEAVKEIADFIEEKQCFGIPSLARRIGLTLRKYCILSAKKADAVRDQRLKKATITFMQLFNNALSQFALGEKKTGVQTNPFLMPFVNDVRIFHCYLEKAAQCAVKHLRERPSAQHYADLCKVTLAQILMFNRRHGEVSQMTIKSFHERDNQRDVQAPEISEALTELEKVFCAEFCKILVRQKVGVLVPIILTPDMINALMLLIDKRDRCSVPRSNIYVFGQPRNNRCYRGENALQICARECGATNPNELTSTKFSRHISTLCQVLTMKNHELKNLAKFIGYDISLSKEYYRESEAMPRLAKICKLILAIEKGFVFDKLGQSLDDIVLPDQITESDSEDEYFEEDDEFLKKGRPKTPSISAPKPEKQGNESTSKEQDKQSTSKEPQKDPAQEQPKQLEQQYTTIRKNVTWTEEEKNAIMKHFKEHIYSGRLATLPECRRAQMMEEPVLNGRSIQKIKDFVRNYGISLQRKMAAKGYLIKDCALHPQLSNSNSTNVQSPQAANTSVSSELSSQTVKPPSSGVVTSPGTDVMTSVKLPSQTTNTTAATITLPPQASSASATTLPS
ncbi:uncharacterized protein LOC128536361 isoform X2 [Clarias gariepinus]|uniref:uncharacterized protein LOC128536361 isoform X2 n=1 Tax=Clarias gariepinus TaxID=13013 RepID=UPI00234CD36F|nr:uncharacterized protein LOC128536361 isoform X2 [Clarias gariepinus]